jgi:cytochrome c peroxidase
MLMGSAYLTVVGALVASVAVSASKGSSSTSGTSGSGDGGSGGGDSSASQFLLTGLRPADPSNIGSYVKSKSAAIVLGKALFWDTQAGSDGIYACASCHFTAGVDDRANNTTNAGPNHSFDGPTDGDTLTAADFPVRTDDVVGSQGVYARSFISVNGAGLGSTDDNCTGTSPHRLVTGKNAPTNINAAFNFRNFWDGRALNVFNGDIRGNEHVFRNTTSGIVQEVTAIAGSSAANQATGPTLSNVEMSCDGRSFKAVGHKLLGRYALVQQKVSATDSVLGSLRHSSGLGLTKTYKQLIQAAFVDNLWNGGDAQMEANFSTFWGLSIQAYEGTLVSDQTPVDRFAAGDKTALSAQEQLGLSVFVGKGRCAQCHSGPLLTEVSKGEGGRAFANTGVRPTAEDPGDVVNGQGRFKTSTIRNVELTGPYFHNGGYGTLRQVVDFYNRGGDFPGPDVDSQVRPLGLSEAESQALVAFMVKLTDERVRYRKAPFDGPQLCVPATSANSGTTVATLADGESGKCYGAVGASGQSMPIARYLGLDPQSR